MPLPFLNFQSYSLPAGAVSTTESRTKWEGHSPGMEPLGVSPAHSSPICTFNFLFPCPQGKAGHGVGLLRIALILSDYFDVRHKDFFVRKEGTSSEIEWRHC